MKHNIKMNYLIELVENNTLKRNDLKFIFEHLTSENKKILKNIMSERKVPKDSTKVNCSKKIRKQHIVTIFNQPSFAAELAIHYGKSFRNQRIAIIDTDRLNPTLEIYLNAQSYIKSVYSHLKLSQSTGLNLLIDAYHKNQLTKSYADHLAIRIKGYKNIYYFSGSYLIDDYEYFNLNALKEVIDFLNQNYDVLIISTNNFIYDAFSLYALIVSDMNIHAISGQLPELRCCKKYMKFLEEKQNIKRAKNYYVLYNNTSNQMSIKGFSEVVEGFYLGNMSYMPQRHASLVDAYTPTRRLKSTQQKEMQKIITTIIKKVGVNESSA